LAAFDGLFLPLLTVDFFILVLWAFAAKALAASRGLAGSMFLNLWEFVVYSLLIGLTAGWVNYLIIKPVWRAITGNASGGAPGSNARTRRNLRLLAAAVGLAVTFLVPAYMLLNENSRKARYGWSVEAGAELHYQVFEADAALVDGLVPFDVREPGNALSSNGTYTLAPSYTATAQMAEIDSAVLSALLQDAATNSGPLVNATRKGDKIYQWEPDVWSYNTVQASGKGQGYCGMGRDMQSARFRIRYRVSHIATRNARYPVTAEISYEGRTPPQGKARAFFIPFGRDQWPRYLVIVFTAKSVPKGPVPEPPGGKSPNGEMKQLPEKTVGRPAMQNHSSSSTAKPKASADQVIVEDLALQMLVAIREKDDAALRALASGRITGWPEALPQFAVELRERFRRLTGEPFDMRESESIAEGNLAAVKCTGSAKLGGKYLVLFFVKTEDGWRNYSLRNSLPEIPLAQHFANFRRDIEHGPSVSTHPEKGK
jgi:hypothetical protein